jgi:hypothetical protein
MKVCPLEEQLFHHGKNTLPEKITYPPPGFLAAFSKPSSCFGLADAYLHRSIHGSSKRLKIHLLDFFRITFFNR